MYDLYNSELVKYLLAVMGLSFWGCVISSCVNTICVITNSSIIIR
jgi:hypothetical protein